MRKYLFLIAFFSIKAAYAQRNADVLSISNYDCKFAIEKYDSLLKQKDSKKKNYTGRGIAKYHCNNLQGAIDDFNEVLSIDSSEYTAYFNRGYVKMQKKDYKGAIDDFTSSIKFKSDFGLAYSYRGIAELSLSNIEKAFIDCDLALSFSNDLRDSKFCYYNRGQVFEEIGKYKEAVDDYKQVIKIDPLFYLALVRSSYLNELSGEYRSAAENYSNLIVLFPNKSELYYERGKLYLKLKEEIRACEDFNKALELGAGDDEERIRKLMKKNCKKIKKK